MFDETINKLRFVFKRKELKDSVRFTGEVTFPNRYDAVIEGRIIREMVSKMADKWVEEKAGEVIESLPPGEVAKLIKSELGKRLFK